MKGFRAPRTARGEPPAPGRNGGRDFRGGRRSDATHASDHRPAGPAPPQGPGQGGAAVPHGPRADGEPAWAGRRRPGQAGPPVRPSATRHAAGWSRPCPAAASDHPLGADKDSDTQGFVAPACGRALNATPHVARNTGSGRRSAIDRRTPPATRHPPPPRYALGQRARQRTEEAGSAGPKEVAPLRRARHRGKGRIGWQFIPAAAAYDLIRPPEPLGAGA